MVENPADNNNILRFPLDRVRSTNDNAERTHQEQEASQDDLRFLYEGMAAIAMEEADAAAEGFKVEYMPQTGILSYSLLNRSPGLKFIERFEKVTLTQNADDTIAYGYEVSVAQGQWKHLARPDKNGRLWNDIVQFPPLQLANAVLTEEAHRNHCAKIQEEVERRARVRRFMFMLGGKAMDVAAQEWARSHYRPGFGSPKWHPQ